MLVQQLLCAPLHLHKHMRMQHAAAASLLLGEMRDKRLCIVAVALHTLKAHGSTAGRRLGTTIQTLCMQSRNLLSCSCASWWGKRLMILC
jgi:hypothetical protein